MKNKALLIATDSFVPQHRATNESIIKALESNKLETSILHICGYFSVLNNSQARDSLINTQDIKMSVNAILSFEEQHKNHLSPYDFRQTSNLLLNPNKLDADSISAQVDYSIAQLIGGNYQDESLIASQIDMGLSCKTSLQKLLRHLPEYKVFIASLIYQNIAISYLSNIELDYKYLIQNSQYSLNYAIYNLANSNHIQHRFYEGHQLFRNWISIYPCPIQDIMNRRTHATSSSLIIDSSTNAYKFAENYIDNRIVKNYSHVYSPLSKPFINQRPEDLLGFSRYIVYFSSSPDEYTAYDTQTQLSLLPNLKGSTTPFSSESEYLEKLVEISLECQIPLVIRLHPRLGTDHRGAGESPYLAEYLEDLKRLCENHKNIRVIHPTENISSYWLGLWATSICAFRGTLSLEMGLLGLSTNLGITNDRTVNTSMPTLYNVHNSTDLINNIQAEIELGYPIMSAKRHRDILLQFYITHCLNRINLPVPGVQSNVPLAPGSTPVDSHYYQFNQCLRFGSSLPQTDLHEVELHDNDNGNGNYVRYLANIKRLVLSAVSTHTDSPFSNSLKLLSKSGGN